MGYGMIVLASQRQRREERKGFLSKRGKEKNHNMGKLRFSAQEKLKRKIFPNMETVCNGGKYKCKE